MFCKTCGKAIPSDALFCANCGTTVEAAPAAALYVPGAGAVLPAKKTLKKPAIFAIAGAAVLLVLVIALAAGGGYKRTVKQFFKAMENGDGELLASLCPQSYMEGLSAREKKERIAQLDAILDNALGSLGKHVKISYKILKTEKDKDFLEENDLEDSYQAMMYVTVKATSKGSKGSETERLTLQMVKEKGKWCILEFT